jgi:hypothetical protein
MASNQNFTMTAGDSKTINVPVVTPADGLPSDITGATITWKASKSFVKTPILSKSTAAGIAITNGTGGIFTITLAAADTVSVDPGDYYHEAQVTYSNGEVATVMRAVMTIEPALI